MAPPERLSRDVQRLLAMRGSARTKGLQPALRRSRRTLEKLQRDISVNTLQARILQNPALRTISLIQRLETAQLPSTTRARLKQKGFRPQPIRGRDFMAVKFKGTEVPITPTGVSTSRFQLGDRTLRETLRHELGHQVLWLKGVPTRRHHDTLK